MNPYRAYEQFAVEGEAVNIREYGEGHINQSYRIETASPIYLLQRINTEIFRSPVQLMENIQHVTEYLRRQIALRGGDPERETLRVIPTKDGQLYADLGTEGCWRLYHFIPNTVTYQNFTEPAVFENCGRTFGGFLADLDGYPVQTLHEVIPEFHNTVQRYHNLEAAVQADAAGRVGQLAKELCWVRERKKYYGTITEALAAGEIPVRVTHNDTKVNNILLDPITGQGICVVDLDTVMPGSSLYDFGDAIRVGAATQAEDCPQPERMHLNPALFDAFVRGYITGARGKLTGEEIRRMPWGAWIMTVENGIRFLTDYIEGDVYYRIHRPDQNLDRARAQFALAADIESKWKELTEITEKYQNIQEG